MKKGSGSKETPYPEEVSWIKVHVSEAELEKESRISADKLSFVRRRKTVYDTVKKYSSKNWESFFVYS